MIRIPATSGRNLKTEVVNWHPFVLAHPSIHEIEIDLPIKLLPDGALPDLQSFTGSVMGCLIVCAGHRPIESITLRLAAPRFDLSIRREKKKAEGDSSTKKTFYWDTAPALQRLAATPTLRRLFLTADTAHMDTDPMLEEHGLQPKFLVALSKSCPHLTHLELHVSCGLVRCLVNCQLFDRV